ncbi:protein jagged-1-like, partial [Anneissia japonica]|uniref:protein jagged-1-like n=1 Tax=Anneissia japonica TaxID=1529436 RepID=UPI001425507C
INECASGPCQNAGTCLDGVNGYLCQCSAGWTGQNCEVDIDECASVPCQNGATCLDAVNSYFCVCAPGWTGAFCTINIDECASLPCQNGGTCTDVVNGYICTCLLGFSGSVCDMNDNNCSPNPCQKNGVCIDGLNTFTCQCILGWTGTLCQTNIDECASSPCLNGGVCDDLVNGYRCTCVSGYTGVVCAANTDECGSSPCQNGGLCVDGVNMYTCTCPPGFQGTHCEININECASSPCQNGGTCLDGNNQYICLCVPGWSGNFCETNLNGCLSEPCLNGGTCTDGVNGHVCECVNVWTDPDCADKMCYREVYDNLTFPDAKVGETVDSEDLCGESKTNYLMSRATRTCKGKSAAVWEDPEINDCGPDATTEQLLERLNSMNVTMENVEEVSNKLEEIISNAKDISVKALDSTAEILMDILQTDANSTEVTQSIVMVVNNLLGVDEDILMESQMRNQAPTKITEVLEGQLGIVELNEKGIYEETTPNIAVQAQMFDATQISEENMINLTFISESNKNGVGAVKVLANGVKIPDAANVSIALPSSISDVISANNITDFRIIVIVYNDSRLFQSAQFINDISGRRPNSQVISLSVPGLDRVELDEPIVTTFIPIEISEANRNTTCVFWDFILDGVGGWSTEGCTFVNGSEDGSDRQYCECTHLTNFAILMDFHQMSSLPPAADIVTTVGLSISIAFLFLTLLIFVSK